MNRELPDGWSSGIEDYKGEPDDLTRIEDIVLGYAKDDTEILFRSMVPIYLFQSQPSRYKITDRNSGEELTLERAILELKLRNIL